VAVQVIDEAEEQSLLQPLAEAQMRAILARDPHATFTFGPGPDRGIWVLDARVAPPLDDDTDFLMALTERAVDFQIEHGLFVATVLMPRKD
jgi:hypothetical protein